MLKPPFLTTAVFIEFFIKKKSYNKYLYRAYIFIDIPVCLNELGILLLMVRRYYLPYHLIPTYSSNHKFHRISPKIVIYENYRLEALIHI